MMILLALLLAVVNSPNPSVSYACDGSTAAYTVNYPYLAYTDLLVTSTTPVGAATTLVYTTDWTVNLASTSSTATLTLNSPGTKCPSGNILKIYRNPALTQPTSFKAQTTYNQTLHEQAYDRAVMQIQEVKADSRTYADSVFAAGLTSSPMTWAATGTGAATVFSLSGATATSSDVYQVTIDGVMQRPATDYSVNSVTQQVTFVAAPALNAVIMVRSLTYVQALQLPVYLAPYVGAVARQIPSKLGDNVSVLDFGVIADGTTDDTAALQAAITACHTDGCEVRLADGDMLVSDSLTFLKPIRFTGHGPGRTRLKVSASLGATKDIILVKPTAADSKYYLFEGFAITPVSGTPGRHAFNFDVTASSDGAIGGVRITQVNTSALGGKGITATCTGTPAVGLFLLHVSDSTIRNGIDLNNCTSDSLLIEHNELSGANAGVRINSGAGAAHVTVFNNNITNAGGGVVVDAGTQVKILYNQIEQIAASTESNSAMIDLIGTAYRVTGSEIIGNNLNSQNNATLNIRLANADDTTIQGNTIAVKDTTGTGINIAAAATATNVGPNHITTSGGSTTINDQSTSTMAWGLRDGAWSFKASQGPVKISVGPNGANGLLVDNANGGGADLTIWRDYLGTNLTNINAAGLISKYNSVATVGWGITAIHGAVVALTAQTANLAATNVYAAAPVGEYRVCATARTTTSGTGTTATLNIIWTDEGGAKTDLVGTWALNSVTVTGQINKCEYIHAAAATNIQVSVTAGTYGTSVYALSATAERLN